MSLTLILYALGVLISFSFICAFSSIGAPAGSGGPGFPWWLSLIFAVLWPVLSVLLVFAFIGSSIYAVIMGGLEKCRFKKG